ncbi:MAG: hypothetical protein OXF23_05145, partial [Candidatus Dadabacteria bacterium]|nr:hypothetical protein [Candidatus Dadabacteria bacterium]
MAVLTLSIYLERLENSDSVEFFTAINELLYCLGAIGIGLPIIIGFLGKGGHRGSPRTGQARAS